jgi:hypothetical protein
MMKQDRKSQRRLKQLLRWRDYHPTNQTTKWQCGSTPSTMKRKSQLTRNHWRIDKFKERRIWESMKMICFVNRKGKLYYNA